MGRNVMVVMARCSTSKEVFGIRIERFRGSDWHMTWAFSMKEDVAKREGFENATVTGAFALGGSYPGCPRCGDRSIFRCGNCGGVGCHNGESRMVTCPSCGNAGELSEAIESLDAGGDR